MNGVLFPNGTQMMLAGDRDDCNAEGAMAAAMRSVLEGATSACLLRSFSMLKVISLPRQARDKHRETTPKEMRFSLAGRPGDNSTAAAHFATIGKGLLHTLFTLSGAQVLLPYYHQHAKPSSICP